MKAFGLLALAASVALAGCGGGADETVNADTNVSLEGENLGVLPADEALNGVTDINATGDLNAAADLNAADNTMDANVAANTTTNTL